MADSCPACGSARNRQVHTQVGVPVNSCLLLTDRQEALDFPTGDIELLHCEDCDFAWNAAFRPELLEYSSRYEASQGYSATFVDFATGLANSWVERYGLAGRSVVEIGCGKGEFLAMMADAGIGHGLGIDPGLDPSRLPTPPRSSLEWDSGTFTSEWGPLDCDAVVCRHTLEHIPDVADFMTTVREAVGDRPETVILFEVPDTRRVIEEVAFWDIYYEHCSYFTTLSLTLLFERCGFEVIGHSLEFGDQYLIIEARPAAAPPGTTWASSADADPGWSSFRPRFLELVGDWNEQLEATASAGGKTVLWGAGSKTVSFLGALGGTQVDATVDVNPHKQGMFLAGSGHRVLSPEELPGLRPDLVVAMNEIYHDEIRLHLDTLGVDAELVSV